MGRPTSCPEAGVEYDSFSEAEREVYGGVLSILLEIGIEGLAAERQAVVAILEHRRLSQPPLFTPSEIVAIKTKAKGYEKSKKLTPREASILVIDEALARKKK